MTVQPYHRNSFLSELSASEFALLRSHLTSFDLRVGDGLQELGKKVDQVVFPFGPGGDDEVGARSWSAEMELLVASLQRPRRQQLAMLRYESLGKHRECRSQHSILC